MNEQFIEYEKKPGIYKISNILNGKSYIGQSINLYRRLNEHLKSKSKSKIDTSIQKYGIDKFIFEVIYIIDNNIPTNEIEKTLNEKEYYYVVMYDTYRNGYNCTNNGQCIGLKRKKIKQKKEKYNIYLSDNNNNHIKEQKENITEYIILDLDNQHINIEYVFI